MLKKASALLLVIMLTLSFVGVYAGSNQVNAQDDDFWIETYEGDPFEDDFFDEDPFNDESTTLSDDDAEAFIAFLGAYFFVLGCFGLIGYLYMALVLHKLGKKLDVDSGWMAWVPLLNMYYFVKLAGFSGWYFLLFFLPIANLIVWFYGWMKIAERRGWESWLGLLTLLPILNFVMPGYFAWAEPSGGDSSAPPAESTPVPAEEA